MTEIPGVPSGQSSVPPGTPGDARPFPYPPNPNAPGAYPLHYPGFPSALPEHSNGLAVPAFVVGTVAVLTSPLLIGLGLGIAAVTMGVSARRRVKRGETSRGGSLAIVGVALGVVAICIGLAVGAILVFGFVTGEFNEDYQHCLGEHNGMAQYCEHYR